MRRAPQHDTLTALALISLCALLIVAALLRPDAGFERMLPLVVGLLVALQRDGANKPRA